MISSVERSVAVDTEGRMTRRNGSQARMMVAEEVVRVGIEKTHEYGTRVGGGVVLSL